MTGASRCDERYPVAVQPVRRTSLIAQVTEQLRAEIRSGRWPIGSRIPTEPELAELTGTGRNTLREAVQALVHAGMLERRQGSGTYVIANSEVSGALAKYFADAQERDILELRQALDTTAAALAAQRRDETDIATMRRLLEERSQSWDEDNPAAIEADVQLHRAIVVASHNAVYLEFYDSLLPVIEAGIRSRTSKYGESYDAEHRELVQAVIDGDPERAAQAARCFLGSLIAEYPAPGSEAE
ncbi:Pyruvate dehydrogenase complex repressor [Nocardia cyriacigeorgica]|jgi:DNA-binding FadR family transcriptional regulator|uniref:Pyruvate dehydrogenase complex repressor n=1 Tax=Nocardia cyriacigeorgica TaxID=135487 RepID=A0A4U8WA75_9NOCA|nr:Pyruvate dehydrogenase complex repressor [Nocardia cyriacigeorgica]